MTYSADQAIPTEALSPRGILPSVIGSLLFLLVGQSAASPYESWSRLGLSQIDSLSSDGNYPSTCLMGCESDAQFKLHRAIAYRLITLGSIAAK